MKYKRILLKISGEALGNNEESIDGAKLLSVADSLIGLSKKGIEIGVVVGGGNFYRGARQNIIERTTADYIGMLATVMNALALGDAIEKQGGRVNIQTAFTIDKIAEGINLKKAKGYLESGKIVIFSGGTGSPYFTTDTGAALRACEIGADILLMAKNIDGLYDSNPATNRNAKKIEKTTYNEVISKNLSLTDLTAITMCKENNMPILAFGLKEENSIYRAATGEKIGSLITN